MGLFGHVTGPSPGQSMPDWLKHVGSWELFDVALFSAILLGFFLTGHAGLRLVAGVVCANVLLVIGGSYWFLKRANIRRIAPPQTVVRLVVAARLVCAILLLVGLPIVLFAPSAGRWDSVYGTMFYVLAVGEYVHYLFFKVNMRPRELRSALSGRPWPRARLAREMHRAHARLARSAAAAQQRHRADGAR